ncbi:MAG: 2-C-methyl-D-erythritol 4-phosphate cytidylyltransferase [Bacteroidetes bacterium]|nr:2-C-methyl-D-erythritol 4-phosphate cytidylyltransferase [Bacteroidota bacterium]
MVAVIIPAAGSGSRLGGLPKQMRLLGDAPMLLHTAQVFDRHPAVSCLVVVGPPKNLDLIEGMLTSLKKPYQVVAGGATRQKSVQAGLKAVSDSTSIVLIHDAARPFVSAQIITKVIESTEIAGAAAVAMPVTDTVRYGEEGSFTNTISRDELYAMQTPQGFKYDLLQQAFCQAEGVSQATDDVALMGHIGQPVRIVEGDRWNVKITTQSDWEWAQQVWEKRA